MLFLMQPLATSSSVTAPSSSTFGYAGFQPVATVFFSLLLLVLREAVR